MKYEKAVGFLEFTQPLLTVTASCSEALLPVSTPDGNEQDKNGNTEAPVDDSAGATSASDQEDTIKVKVAYNKTIYETVISKSQTVQDLKYAVQVRSFFVGSLFWGHCIEIRMPRNLPFA